MKSSKEFIFVILLLLTLSINVHQVKGAEGCVQYRSTHCGVVTDLYSSPSMVYGDPLFLSITDQVLTGKGFDNITILGPLVFPTCYDVALKYICGSYFPQCGANNTKVPLCQETCTSFKSECSALLKSFDLESLIPDCASFPTSSCTNMEFVPSIATSYKCPSPLLPNPDFSVERFNCPGLCCIPCPVGDYFYKEGHMSRAMYAINAVNAIFSVFSLTVFVAYALIPKKRVYPQSFIMQMSLALGIILFSGWILIYVGRENVVCMSEIDMADYGTNHPACVTQSFFLTVGYLCTVLWFFAICLNIFLVVFFRVKYNPFYVWSLTAFAWGAPVAIMIGLIAGGQIGSRSSSFCSIKDPNVFLGVFNVFSSIFLYSSLILNFAITFRVYMLTRETKKSFQAILKLQFRPLLMSSYSIIILTAYWIYSQIVYRSSVEDYIQDWFLCIGSGLGQNECSSVAKGYIPSLPGLVAIQVFLSSIGLVAFFTFGFKKDVWDGIRGITHFEPNSSRSGTTNPTTTNNGTIKETEEMGPVPSTKPQNISE